MKTYGNFEKNQQFNMYLLVIITTNIYYPSISQFFFLFTYPLRSSRISLGYAYPRLRNTVSLCNYIE